MNRNEDSKIAQLSEVRLDHSKKGYFQKLFNRLENNIIGHRFAGEASEETKKSIAASYIMM